MCISSTSIKIIDYLFLHLYLRVIPIMQVIHLSYMYNNCLLNDFIIYYIHAYIYWNLWWYLILKFSKLTWHNFGEFLYTTSCNFTRLLWYNKHVQGQIFSYTSGIWRVLPCFVGLQWLFLHVHYTYIYKNVHYACT